MTKTLSTIAAVALLGSTLHAEESTLPKPERNDLISVYGVNAKTDANHPSHNGGGLFYNTEALKVMMENTAEFFKVGTVIKFNPFDEKLYFKLGGNYINQRLYAPDNTSAKVNQYSAALGAGYMIDDDLYVELGGSTTKLEGSAIGTVYAIDDERTNRAYAEIAKRFDTSVGTLDTTFNAGRVYKEFTKDENSYGAGVDYYPTSNVKLGYYYTHTDNAIANTYSLSYGYLTASYSESLSQKTHYASLGVQFAFSDISDLSTYRMPTNIKPHLSELHAFEQMTFGANMNLQSSNGVHRTTALTDNATTASPPTLDSATATTINTTAGTFADTDGVRNVTVVLYSDAGLTTLVASNANGDFTGLSAGTTYYAVTSGEAFNAETQTWESKRSSALSITLAQANINLGAYGNLIAPVSVNGNWYYFWDLSGDGTSADAGALNGGVDYTTHNFLDGLFVYDINGVANTTVQNVDGNYGTTNDYRYATLNGVNLALLTSGTGLANETSSYYLNDNGTYTDLAAIWAAHNSGNQTSGTPVGWQDSIYWSATPSTNGHAGVLSYDGSVDGSFPDSDSEYVAVQVR
ncbi:hypothetical protein [Sulfuricurvum kujiense]|uniref:hypothetical protein n=1 Tax=Sulfuricurvum kujiense TaxID=148813 RepID=UPI00267ABAD8|nr:hypothetical protein [Sulfuricurvum kujiense]